MALRTPAIHPVLIVADDARLAARLSCLLVNPGSYLPVVQGPRMWRPDLQSEIVRLNNVCTRARPETIILAGLSAEAEEAIRARFAPKFARKLKVIRDLSELGAISSTNFRPTPGVLVWGPNHIGVGLLKALRGGELMEFTKEGSSNESIKSKSGHLVVCEDDEDLSQVIAANYAHSLDAGLHLIPKVDDHVSEQILEEFYSLYDQRETSQTEALENLAARLRSHCGSIPFSESSSVTFVTHRLPYGFAFPEVPSTHLFCYPDLGISVVNGFAAEQPKTRGVSVAIAVDPGQTLAGEIEQAKSLLPSQGIFLRGYEGPAANLRAVSEMIELFPYDLLIIATHCGDAPGYRWTYQFVDSEGIDRTLVVDLAVTFAATDDTDLLAVTQFMSFVSLDGVDWHDPKKKESLYVGRAIIDFMERTRPSDQERLKPIKKETIPRVRFSAVLKMFDQNLITLPKPIADHGTPIVINNACSSWHRLAHTYTDCDARAYIGTLFPVATSEAEEIAIKLLGKYFGKLLPLALWRAQNDVYGEGVRRPYILIGVCTQRLRCTRHDVPAFITSRISRALQSWKDGFQSANATDARSGRKYRETISYYERELVAFRKNWPQGHR